MEIRGKDCGGGGKSKNPQVYWDLSNEHMTSGGRKFYYNKGKVVS